MLPALDKRGELFSLLIAECHDVLLHCVLFAGHESAPSLVTGTSIQRTCAESMTETTSGIHGVADYGEGHAVLAADIAEDGWPVIEANTNRERRFTGLPTLDIPV